MSSGRVVDCPKLRVQNVRKHNQRRLD